VLPDESSVYSGERLMTDETSNSFVGYAFLGTN
jgi:hypothetical protein